MFGSKYNYEAFQRDRLLRDLATSQLGGAPRPGDRAPDFVVPAVHEERTISLADYRGRAPLLLGLFRGLYCPFCRRALAQMAPLPKAPSGRWPLRSMGCLRDSTGNFASRLSRGGRAD